MLNHIDSEVRQKIQSQQEFKMPNYRSGDVLDVTMFTSISEGKYNTLRGIVVGNKQRNNLRAAFKLHTVIDDVNTTIMVKENSPLLAKVEVVQYGSNQNRKKLNYIPDLELSKGRVTEPLKKGRNFKHRDEMFKAGEQKSAKVQRDPNEIRGKAKRDSVQLQQAEDF